METENERIVEWLIKRGFLVSPDILNAFETLSDIELLKELVNKGVITSQKMLSAESIKRILLENRHEIPDKVSSEKQYENKYKVKVISSYNKESSDRSVQDFVKLFNARFKELGAMINAKARLKTRISISRLLNKNERQSVSVIGIIDEISYTKNGHIMAVLDDGTGQIPVLFNKANSEVYKEALSLTPDEVIGVNATTSKSMLFADEILRPEVPVLELKKSPLDEYAIFLSDFHFGSKQFLKEEFDRFIDWLNGRIGNASHKEIARKIKYVFIVGDLVDGVGIYPNQYHELKIKDIYEQYKACSEKIAQIPEDKAIIICPGNHDAMRLSEPQPPLTPKLVPELYSMPNVFLVSNPASVNIGATENFSGFNVLMYHGYSFDYYVANVEEIRNNGGYDKPELIMKFLLRRRHLAPTYGSTLYVPESAYDPLIIRQVPDIFATGHIHKSTIKMYRNITLISGSCWQSKTSFQEKVGHHPEPARVPIVHLKTRKVKLLKFTK